MSQAIVIKKGAVSATINSMGAELTSLKKDDAEYLWQANPAFWGRHAPVLFPIVGSLRNGVAESAQGTCKMGRHGIARLYEHEVAQVSEDEALVTFELTSNDEMHAAYPYDFKLQMEYEVTSEESLRQTFRVTNTGDVPMPFSVGGHPAFNVPCPNSGDEAFEDYVLEFTEAWTCDLPTVTPNGLLSEAETYQAPIDSNAVAITHRSFDNDAMVFTDTPNDTLTLLGTKSGHGVRVHFPDFKFIGVWSAANDAPFVALEPWSGHATMEEEDDIFEHKRNITTIAPGETKEFTFTITVF